jgi:hypothetical protein
MKYAVAELEGALLDEAVAKAEGWKCEGNAWSIMHSATTGQVWCGDVFPFSCSNDWKWGGPIIEREGISVIKEEWRNDGLWFAAVKVEFGAHERADHRMSGPTPLIAAMRTLVASKFGKEVDI